MQNRTAQRISLSLSLEAYSTIISDMDIFQREIKLDGFINKILENYKDSSDASISLAKEREREKYENWLKTLSGTNRISAEDSACLDRLTEGYAKELKVKMNSYSNGVPLKPRIHNNIYDDLKFGGSDFQEEAFYAREGKYIKAILEEYALLSFYEREGVFFKDTIDYINEAIAIGNILKLEYINRKQAQTQLTVRPYKIVSSSLLRYHYLLALPHNAKSCDDILILRISRIIKCEKQRKTSHITNAESSIIDEMIRTKGIEYIVAKDSEVEVSLTEQGYKLYKSILYLRPKCTGATQVNDKWILKFVCAEEQIKNYFFQFGKEAEIVSPETLRLEFFEKYREAAKVYDN